MLPENPDGCGFNATANDSTHHWLPVPRGPPANSWKRGTMEAERDRDMEIKRGYESKGGCTKGNSIREQASRGVAAVVGKKSA